MSSPGVSLQYFGYGLAGIVFLLLAVLLLTRLRGRLGGGQLVAVTLMSAAWAFLLAWAAAPPGLSPSQLFFVETLHGAAWLFFLGATLHGAVGSGPLWIVRYGTILLPIGTLTAGVGLELYSRYDLQAPGAGSITVICSLLIALFMLVAIEQIYRNARESQRHSIKFLCLGVGGIFAYNLFLYSNAVLAGEISELLWVVRGFVVAMCVPLIALAAQRSPSWSGGIFVSRQIVFHSATLISAGIYLSVVGITVYYVRFVGGQWGPAAQIIVFCAAVIALLLLFSSDRLRGQFRVFISKHFFENKYDYREEWLRLIDTLTSVEETMPLKKRAIKALAKIMSAPSGVLWTRDRDSNDFHCVSSWNIAPAEGQAKADDSLVRFLSGSGWLIEVREYTDDPERYDLLELNLDSLGVDDPAVVVPLLHDAKLLGFVVLSQARTSERLNFEDRDLLKTAGQQIASYLAQEMATEQLAEGRQFEAFNRLTAYLMHDLKNVIAQQSLVVSNARKYKTNPEFIDDAVATIGGGVARMRRIVEHIQQNPSVQHQENVEMSKLIMQAASQCADRDPLPQAQLADGQIWVRGDKDRLHMALYHAIRNAQDATEPDGTVVVTLEVDESTCFVKIVDSGSGMDEQFVRERLFKPFDSTKGTQGMGIGAYQIRETVRAMDGEVHVQSMPGHGTSMILELRTVS